MQIEKLKTEKGGEELMGEDKEKKTKTKRMKIGIEIKEDQELETDKKENGR